MPNVASGAASANSDQTASESELAESTGVTDAVAGPEQKPTELPQLRRAVLVRMSDVKPRAQQWLWSGRIPLGAITIFDGDPGNGKSLITVDLAARVSRGSPMPDGSRSDIESAADVVMIFCEDAAETTVRPRLDVAGADTSRIVQLTGSQQSNKDGVRPFTLADVDMIGDAIDQTGARLVVVDPWAAYLGGRDSRDESKMRQLLSPLADLAEKYRVSVVIIRHLRKAGGSALHAGGGSVSIAGAARSVWLAARDPADPERCVLAYSKGNLAAPAQSLTYSIESESVELPDDNGKMRSISIPKLSWGDVCDAKADDLIAAARADAKEKTEREAAEEWLLDTAFADGPLESKELEKLARKAGHTQRTLERARSKLREAKKLWRHKDGFGCWYWGLGERPEQAWLDERARWAARSSK